MILWEGDKNSSVINIVDVEQIPAIFLNETNYIPVFDIVDTRNDEFLKYDNKMKQYINIKVVKINIQD